MSNIQGNSFRFNTLNVVRSQQSMSDTRKGIKSLASELNYFSQFKLIKLIYLT